MWNQAQVAKIIRQELKNRGIDAKVKSTAKGAGSTVRIAVNDVDPKTFKQLRAYVNDFRYNPHFSDLPLNHTPSDDVPKVEYLFIENNFSTDLYQKALDYVTEACGLPAMDYNQTKPNDLIKICSDMDYHVGDVLIKVLKGLNCHTFHYWEQAA